MTGNGGLIVDFLGSGWFSVGRSFWSSECRSMVPWDIRTWMDIRT